MLTIMDCHVHLFNPTLLCHIDSSKKVEFSHEETNTRVLDVQSCNYEYKVEFTFLEKKCVRITLNFLKRKKC